MNSLKWPQDDPLDVYLERSLSSWASRQNAPKDLRGRLLHRAAAQEMDNGLYDTTPAKPAARWQKEYDMTRAWRSDLLVSYFMFSFQVSNLRMMV